jgi:uncharacterized protein (TIGR02246 family)
MSNRILYFAYSFCILLAIATVCSAGSIDSEIRVAIEEANQKFMDALSAKDSATVAGLYAENAKILPPNLAPVEGKENIRKFWQGLVDNGMVLKLATDEVHTMGNLAAEVGAFKAVTSDGKEQDNGKYMVLWIKENGKWKLYRDMWSSNNPPVQ